MTEVICEKNMNGQQPIDCKKVVQCVGPKLSAEHRRIIELEKKVKDLEAKRCVVYEPLPFHCQCCGQEVVGHECGC